MRLLWLSAGLLLPLDKGGKLRSWHLLRHLARQHEVTYLGFEDRSTSLDDLQGMRAVCAHLETVRRTDAAKGTVAFYLDAAHYLTDPLPYAVAKYRSVAYRERLAQLVASRRFDALICDFLVPVVNVPRSMGLPSVLFTHNVEAEIWRRHTETEARRWRRVLLRQQWARMKRFEGRTLARFDTVLAVSDADDAAFRRLYPGQLRGPVHVIPTGVDVSYFAPSGSVPLEPYRLVFTGSMDWLPNEDAILHFVRVILPAIRQHEPRVTLSIVGRNPTQAVARLASVAHGIEVTGRVPDVRPYLERAAVAVVPLRIGGGTRLKIFEAMAMGKAVVSTTVGAEGLPLDPDRNVVLRDDPQDFADAVTRLLHEPAERDAVGRAARDFVRSRFDWPAVAGALEDAVRRTVARQAARTATAPALEPEDVTSRATAPGTEPPSRRSPSVPLPS